MYPKESIYLFKGTGLECAVPFMEGTWKFPWGGLKGKDEDKLGFPEEWRGGVSNGFHLQRGV